jgi:hypothetical protein
VDSGLLIVSHADNCRCDKKSVCNTIHDMLPFQGDIIVFNVTRRVTAGWLILPFQGVEKILFYLTGTTTK